MSDTFIQPYLFFGGRCNEALEFYKATLDAQIEMVMLYKDSPEPMPPGILAPGFENKVMHCSFRIGTTTIMGSDGCDVGPGFSGFSLSLTVPTEADADRVFAALAENGRVLMPLTKTFWSRRYGMLTDRFGIGWVITVPAKPV